MTGLSKERLRQLSLIGAMARLGELRGEASAIRQAFPELGRKLSSDGVADVSPLKTSATVAGKSSSAADTSSNRMSLAARRAVSARMKKYWAERRKAKAGKKK